MKSNSEKREWSDGPTFKTWQMFDRIATTYDLLNHTLSGGIDIIWRKKLARMVPVDAKDYLDLATGTGDQLIAVCRERPGIKKATGMDLSEGMLAIGREKIPGLALRQDISMVTGDAMDLPAEDNSFDAMTMSFGIRNVEDVPKALSDIHRVLRPGGKALIMEFAMPTNPVVRAGYSLYFRHILPTVGGWVSGDKSAYAYLNQSAEAFAQGEAFCTLMKEAGFGEVSFTPLTFGIANIYQGVKR
tara:strand:+ start:9029 stop:9760 length:732 start_codon:yes stop_codon:yes gene_type:complete